MAKFNFQAKGMGGKTVKGEIDAVSIVEARVKLRSQRLIPVKVTENTKIKGPKEPKGGGTVDPKELQIFTRQFSTLINSGIPIVQSLAILNGAVQSLNLKAALTKIRADVETGTRLGDALKPFPKIFDNLYVNLVKAGEESGALDGILNRLAVYIEKSVKIRSKVKGAMFYPIAILCVSFLVITGILLFVIPKFEEMFKASNQKLPALTEMVVAASHFVGSYWYLVFGGAFALGFGAKAYYESPNGKKQCDKVFIRLPFLGDIIQKAAIARFTRTLSTMLSSGVSMIDALDIAGKTIGNSVMEGTVFQAIAVVQEGKSMTVAFSKDPFYPDMVVQMIGVGEQTGALDTMLGKIADFYEEEVDYAVTAMTSILEPLMMVFLGGIIAVLVVAMYLPIFNLAGSVS